MTKIRHALVPGKTREVEQQCNNYLKCCDGDDDDCHQENDMKRLRGIKGTNSWMIPLIKLFYLTLIVG